MTPEAFRRSALKLEGVVESAHHDHPDFRCNGRVFASLSPEGQSWAMVKLAPEEQAAFARNDPAVFSPFTGAWGKAGCTRILLASAPAAAVGAALLMAWRLATAAKQRKPKSPSKERPAARSKAKDRP